MKPTLASYKTKAPDSVLIPNKLAKMKSNLLKRFSDKKQNFSPKAVVDNPNLKNLTNNFLQGIKKRNLTYNLPRMPLNTDEITIDKESGEPVKKK